MDNKIIQKVRKLFPLVRWYLRDREGGEGDVFFF